MTDESRTPRGGFREARAAARAELTAEKLIRGALESVAAVAAAVWALQIVGLFEPLRAYILANTWTLLKCWALYFFLLRPLLYFAVLMLFPPAAALAEGVGKALRRNGDRRSVRS
ncbi:MAG: hypothetical protein ACK47B_25200 [Armatimonadota bacterium]